MKQERLFGGPISAHASISGLEMVARYYDETEDQFKEITHQLPLKRHSIEIVIRAHPAQYELFFVVQEGEQSAGLVKLGEISSTALTTRRSGKESPNTRAHFAIYAQGAYDKSCFDPAHSEFVEWTAVSPRH
ncbi:hypothetical protein N7476_010828 [Penicillium atrosanguineum]|uniref:Uncharacterized protein n=1 Tax=Penicillium atrosanguineum TaxID=1132637 RepID=A0A9W9TZ01_9EURO|nr:hypothetical protein N7526_010105 [Penicillium atrosanguineum]KAJ5299271.1 hypothetical protein N7476_010828 [Penicillium atrosanguineum]